MKMVKVFLFFILSVLLSFLSSYPIFADSLVIQNDGKVTLLTNTGSVEYFLFSQEKFTNSHVLGASSGVVITVSLSSFLPTDTPIPTVRHTATPTPSSNNSSPTSTPTPIPTTSTALPAPTSTFGPKTISSDSTLTHFFTPTPKPSSHLIASITTPSNTTTQEVRQVTQEASDGNSLVISSTTDGKQMLITDRTIYATTSLPIQLNTESKTLQVIIQNTSYPVVSPTTIIQTLQSVGTYIIPSTITMDLTSVNNQPIYQVTGSQHVQIFNTFILDFPLTLDIEAGTGTQIHVKNPFIVTVLEFSHIGKRVLH